MTLLVAASFRRMSIVATGLVLLFAARADAQTSLSHTEDAAPIPQGMLRLRVINAWTRFDQRYGANGLVALGDDLSADPLGTTQLPRLAPIEESIQTLAANPRMRLSLGRLVTQRDARIVTTPIAVEYGLTRRISIGVLIPVVQTRGSASVRVNSSTGAPANVGFVPPSQRGAATESNRRAAESYQLAATQLGDLITRCQATPSGAGCAPVVGDASGAAAARALAQQFAAAATALGTSTSTPLIAPRANGNFAVEIELQRNAFNRQLQLYLGAGAAQASQIYFAPTDFSYIDLQGRDGTPGLLQSEIGGGLDSIRTTDRLGVGDISIGVQVLVFDRFQRDSLPLRGLQSRLSVGGSIRLATSRPDTATNLVDIGTGDGAGFELRSALDVIRGRVGATIAGRYVKSLARVVSAPLLGDPDSGLPLPFFGPRERTAGDVMGLDVTPRYLLSETFAIDGHYGLERIGATTYSLPVITGEPPLCSFVSCAAPLPGARTAQRLGLGLRYSTVDAHARGTASFPVEVSFTHLTTISGDPGIAKESREQVQLRLFYRLFGR